MKTLCAIVASLISCTASTNACNVPVFRYALERWQADSSDIVVFRDQPFNEFQQSTINDWQTAKANVKVFVQETSGKMDDSIGLLWDEFNKQTKPELPFVVVRSAVAASTINGWHGSLHAAQDAELLTSPARKTLSQRLLSGHSAVWLVLKSNNKARNAEVVSLLEGEFERLSNEIPLPEGIGLPGSELFSDIPLLMKFSVLEIDPSDPREQFLTELLRGFEPDTVNNGQPLVVPVFGRGRALEVIPGDLVNEGLIEDLTLFLCGACSCQVKERNPGFDLLLTARWDVELFGEDADSVSMQFAADDQEIGLPVLMEIPSGRALPEQFDSSQSQQQVIQSAPENHSSVGWMVVLLTVMMMSIALFHSLKS